MVYQLKCKIEVNDIANICHWLHLLPEARSTVSINCDKKEQQ